MADYWRLTRNRYTRRVYDALKTAGITATRMYEYRATVARTDATRSPATPPGVSLDAVPASEANGLDIDFSLPVEVLAGEWVVVASVDGRPVARALVTDESSPYVEPLERAVPVRGAYVRRVFVAPEQRGRGVASAVLRAAVALAAGEFDADAATALIAADNRPSQGLFEGRGFERVGVHEYARAGPFSWYRRRVD
jgi:GNAT superfamily N-acetyltransferase